MKNSILVFALFISSCATTGSRVVERKPSSSDICSGIGASGEALADYLIDFNRVNESNFHIWPTCPAEHHLATARDLANLATCMGAKGISDAKADDNRAIISRDRKTKAEDKFYYSDSGYVRPNSVKIDM